MGATIQPKTGQISGGNECERLALRLCYGLSFVLRPWKYRGFWRLTTPICRLLGVRGRQWIQLDNDITLSVDLTEPYWNRLISPNYIYEPELHTLFQLLRETEYRLIDCGANIGYWSVQVSSLRYGQKPCIAIEALPSNAAILHAHNAANHSRFTVLQRAISDEPNQEVRFYYNSSHASASLIAQEHHTAYESVATTTLDTLLTEQPDPLPVVLKLDVEGVEIRALQGAQQLLSTLPLIIYEDHARDRASEVTAGIIRLLPEWKICFMHEDGGLIPVQSAEEASVYKQIPDRGYNFLAFHPHSPFASYMAALS